MANLSYQRQTEILSKVVPIADSARALSQSLRTGGYLAFLVWQEYIASFCTSDEDEAHHTYEIEEAKVWIGTPDGFPSHLVGKERGYVSPILSRWKDQRDIAAVTSTAASAKETFRLEIDPCRRRLGEKEFNRDPVVRIRRDHMKAQFEYFRDEEIRRHATVSDPTSYSPDLYNEIFVNSVDAKFGALGFHFDVFRSRKFFPVFSKPITDWWDLCCSPASATSLRDLPKYGSVGGPMRTPMELLIYVRAKGAKGPVDIPIGFPSLNTMLIRYNRIIDGFQWAYSGFSSAREMEVIVGACSSLYALVGEFIEAALSAELAKIGDA